MEILDLASFAQHPAPYFVAMAALVWYRLNKGEQKMDSLDAKIGALDRRMSAHEKECFVRHTSNVEERANIKGDIKALKQQVEKS